ncbi:hypothetical protein, partial [Helicobacter pylori]|uniref:hypothetical protein n=1 Tax=Helicobacter pylori TaxID=210 RepID=UPI001C5A9960
MLNPNFWVDVKIDLWGENVFFFMVCSVGGLFIAGSVSVSFGFVGGFFGFLMGFPKEWVAHTYGTFGK